MMDDKQKAWDKFAEQEANTLAELLATDNRVVMVIVIGAESDEIGTTNVLHGVAGEAKGAHLQQIIFAVEHKLRWLRSKMFRRVG